MALFSGEAKPFKRLSIILRNAKPFIIRGAKLVLGVGVSLLGKRTKMPIK